MKIKRLIYFGYYLKKLDWSTLNKFQVLYRKKYNAGIIRQWIIVLINSIYYNISILEYYQFSFWTKSSKEKKKWAGTGYMYDYQRLMNPPNERGVLDDKREFYQRYYRFFKHHVVTLTELEKDLAKAEVILTSKKMVLKESRGKCGLGTAFYDTANYTPHSLLKLMKDKGYDLAETFIQQHPDLKRLSPSGVNTVRIFTQINAQGQVDILGCRQRISVNSPVDNMAAGNLAASIDETTGIINGPGVYSDITKAPETHHPVTGVAIVGFQVPYWEACLGLAINAAKLHPENRSIGWDIVVTSDGPGLIEGNHDWCKLVWQLPVNKGLKPILEKHLAELKNQ